jgi:hypothetical protein
MDDNTQLNDKLKVIIVSYRIKENEAFRPSEEILLKLIFKASGIQYEKRISYDNTLSSFFGNLPCLYINGNIIHNRKIFKFVRSILDGQYEKNDADYDKLVDLIEYTISQQLKNNMKIYYNLKRNEKKKNSSKFFTRLKHYLFPDAYYIKTACDYLNIEHNDPNNTTQNIINCYNNIHYILFQKGRLNKPNENAMFNLIEAYLYSFLKEEKTLFNEVNRPTLQNIKVDNKVNLEAIYEFYTSYDKVRKTIRVNLKPQEEIIKQALEFSKVKGKEKKKDEIKDLVKFENDSSNKHNLIFICLFVGISLVSYIIGRRRKNNSNKSNN